MPSSVLDKPEQKSRNRGTEMSRRTMWPASPTLQRLSNEMDRLFDELGFGRAWLQPGGRTSTPQIWAPAIEVQEKDGQIKVRADLPGMKRDDIQIQLTDEGLTIEGERRRESEENKEGYFRSERSYGSFYRVVPLPDGVQTDKARASFKDGVLEVSIPVPEQKRQQARRIDIEG